MASKEIRRSFLDFFVKKKHLQSPSSSLVPIEDPSLLFTNAGMVPFKNVFTGLISPPSPPRMVSVQKCLRAGGKHNDLENVGKTLRHHTFFEMLGNFSFGDYFKKEAILFAWEFLIDVLRLPRERLYITVHEDDEEAWNIWKKEIGIDNEHLFFCGDKDNFWSMGEEGPCGPCSEIFFDYKAAFSQSPSSSLSSSLSSPSKSSKNLQKKSSSSLKTSPPYLSSSYASILENKERYVEIWNLVFMQYETYRNEKGERQRRSLPRPSVDTGMGLERMSAVLQGVKSNFDTDLFSDLIQKIETLSQKSYKDPNYSESIRVIADHMRSATLLTTEMVFPSNEGRGYVLRRIIRRAVRHLHRLGISKPSLHLLVDEVFQGLKGAYPQNEKNHLLAKKYLHLEESHFQKTLSLGMNLLTKEIQILKEKKKSRLSGKTAFKMHDTYGFPLDLTEVILKESNLNLDHQEFQQEMKEQKKRSKTASLFSSDREIGEKDKELEQWKTLKSKLGPTQFVGYEKKKTKAKLLKILYQKPSHNKTLSSPHLSLKLKDSKQPSQSLDKTEEKKVPWALLFDFTTFYGASGGQAGDEGVIKKDEEIVASIHSTLKPLPDLHLHILEKSKTHKDLKKNETYLLCVNEKKRSLIAKNHSATHLMHAALIQSLGEHVKQAGSSVTSQNLRFDFTHPEPLKKEELSQVEDLVNREIEKSLPVITSLMTKSEALSQGAMALFDEKYGEKVRVVKMGDFSLELCGGTHVSFTNQIGLFSILSESSLSSGVRRIEAVTSEKAYQRFKEKMQVLENLETQMQTRSLDLPSRLQQLLLENHKKEKEIKLLRQKLLSLESESLFQNPEPLPQQGVFKIIPVSKKEDMREIGDLFICKHPNGVALIYTSSKNSPRTSVLLKTSKGNKTLDCSFVLKKILSKYEGHGGGKPDNAQGSVAFQKLEEVKKDIREILLHSRP